MGTLSASTSLFRGRQEKVGRCSIPREPQMRRTIRRKTRKAPVCAMSATVSPESNARKRAKVLHMSGGTAHQSVRPRFWTESGLWRSLPPGQRCGFVRTRTGTFRLRDVTQRDASNTSITLCFARFGRAPNTNISLDSHARCPSSGKPSPDIWRCADCHGKDSGHSRSPAGDDVHTYRQWRLRAEQ